MLDFVKKLFASKETAPVPNLTVEVDKLTVQSTPFNSVTRNGFLPCDPGINELTLMMAEERDLKVRTTDSASVKDIHPNEWFAAVDRIAKSLPGEFNLLRAQRPGTNDDEDKFNSTYLYESKDGLTLLYVNSSKYGSSELGNLWVSAYGNEIGPLTEFTNKFINQLKAPATPEDKVEIKMWYVGSHGPTYMTKRLDCPIWQDIKQEYPTEVMELADAIISGKPKRDSGLILWHGSPGTGKTTAIRSLMREWKEWADIHLVTDPERLLADTSYINQLTASTYNDQGKPVLIILEDAGELISSDARNNTGQGLSRLLNMTDGIFGQGQKVYVLVTTNEPLDKMHEAVRRPGRCVSNIDFIKLRKDEIAAWCKRHGLEVDDLPPENRKESTLAELFAVKDGFIVKHNDKDSKKQPIGFSVG